MITMKFNKAFYLIALTTFVFGFSEKTFAQTIQTYNGVFEKGKATYQYYENDKADRIYQGSFKYIGDVYTFLGQFKENKRNGKWKITAVNKNFVVDKQKTQANTTINLLYRNGLLDSICTFSQSMKYYNPKTKKLGTKAEKIVSTASFKASKFAGKISYERIFLTKKSISGQFNDAGYIDGTWTIKTAKEVEEIKYKNGLEYARVLKDITTGDKKVFYDSSAFIDQFWKAYDYKNQLAIVNGKMYFLDTFDVSNEAVTPWRSEQLATTANGNVPNPFFNYKKGQLAPLALEVKIIECDMKTDCYKVYMEKKAAENLKAQQAKEEEERLAQAEALRIQEELRIEREKERIREEERIKRENLSKTIEAASSLEQDKKYKQALANYLEANSVESSPELQQKIAGIQKEIARIDSLHSLKRTTYLDLKVKSQTAFEQVSSNYSTLTQKKKVYGKNYMMCIDVLKGNFQPKLEALSGSGMPTMEQLEAWTDADQKELESLQQLQKDHTEIAAFQAAVSEALTKNNKAKLRVLNSSLNPKVIIHDLINFK